MQSLGEGRSKLETSCSDLAVAPLKWASQIRALCNSTIHARMPAVQVLARMRVPAVLFVCMCAGILDMARNESGIATYIYVYTCMGVCIQFNMHKYIYIYILYIYTCMRTSRQALYMYLEVYVCTLSTCMSIYIYICIRVRF